jgi:hypothetical protein
MLGRWFLKRLAGVRAADLRGSHESRIFFQIPRGEARAFFTCPEKNIGMPVEAIQVLPISI